MLQLAHHNHRRTNTGGSNQANGSVQAGIKRTQTTN